MKFRQAPDLIATRASGRWPLLSMANFSAQLRVRLFTFGLPRHHAVATNKQHHESISFSAGR
jgi:hypothetical protein